MRGWKVLIMFVLTLDFLHAAMRKVYVVLRGMDALV